jgi:2-succinyl-6-hydroxy-2,4-cyclohexadiene-1-carboxylate synthase
VTSAPQVCFVHGFLGDRHDWDPVRDQLANDVRCMPLELPGHGSAGSALEIEGDTLERAADQLAVRARGMAVVGYSMGGRLALLAAARSPTAFSHLLLIGADPGIESAAARQGRARADDALAARLTTLDGGGFRQFLTEWYAAPLFGDLRRRAGFEELLLRRLAHSPASVAVALRALSVGRQPSLWPALLSVGQPTMYLVGSQDAKYTAVAERIRDSGAPIDVHSVPGAAHALHREDPRAVASRLLALLGRP